MRVGGHRLLEVTKDQAESSWEDDAVQRLATLDFDDQRLDARTFASIVADDLQSNQDEKSECRFVGNPTVNDLAPVANAIPLGSIVTVVSERHANFFTAAFELGCR